MSLGIIFLVGTTCIACYFLFDSHMWKKVNMEAVLRKELEKQNKTLLSIEKTGRLETGPFPKFEIKAATSDEPAIIIPGIPVGNKTLYKKGFIGKTGT